MKNKSFVFVVNLCLLGVLYLSTAFVVADIYWMSHIWEWPRNERALVLVAAGVPTAALWFMTWIID